MREGCGRRQERWNGARQGSKRLVQSHLLERLAEALSRDLLEARRRRFSFAPDIVLVNNQEMAQWLACRMAERDGICANVKFMLTGSFVWRLSQWTATRAGASGAADMTGPPVLGREHLRWLFFALLQEMEEGAGGKGGTASSHEGLLRLLEYARHHGGRGLYGLAGQLAAVFDRYMNYRHDVLEAWKRGDLGGVEEGQNATWQMRLWQEASSAAHGEFKVSMILDLLHRLRNRAWNPPDWLGTTLYVFGVSYLPPFHLEALDALSGFMDVSFYHLVPCKEYWLDLVKPRIQEGLKGKFDPETVESLFPVGNRLLVSLGEAGRRFLLRFYDLDFACHEELFDTDAADTLLKSVQHSVVHLCESPKPNGGSVVPGPVVGLDSSIEIHSCHSRLREVEVLHDRLVELFRSEPGLGPHEVAVMAPDIALYAKFVEGVFGAAPPERQIPWSIADLGYLSTAGEAHALTALMDIAGGEFKAPDIMDLLGHLVVMGHFGLDSSSLSFLRRMVRFSGIRRGLETLSVGCGIHQNTWRFGLDRLLAAMCIDHDGAVKLPDGKERMTTGLAIEGDVSRYLLILSHFVSSIEELRQRIHALGAAGGSPEEWLELILDTVDRFILRRSEWEGSQVEELTASVRELMEEMRSAGVNRVPFGALKAALEERLARPLPQRTFFSGGVLFSSLVPLRTIPFKVICLMGMNQGEFPRQDSRPSYDLTLRHPRLDDRVARDEDRYLFLETLMAARERLIITYVGRRETDNQRLNPSTVVSELLEFIEPALSREERGRLVVEHPLQPFGSGYLQRHDSRINTFAREWLPVDEEGRPLKPAGPEPFARFEPDWREVAARRLEEMGEGALVVSPDRLACFFAAPVRHYLREVMEIDLDVGEAVLDDHEPFSLPRWLDEEVVMNGFGEVVAQGRAPEEASGMFGPVFRRLELEGRLPPGDIGGVLWKEKVESVYMPIFRLLAERDCLPVEVLDCDMVVEQPHVHVRGRIGFLHSGKGLVDVAYTIAPFTKIRFWVRHLLASLHGMEGESVLAEPKSVAVSFSPAISRKDLLQWAGDLLSLFLAGQYVLVPFIPDASYLLAKEVQPKQKKADRAAAVPVSHDSIDRRTRVEKAAKVHSALERGVSYRREDPWIRYIARGHRLPPLSWLSAAPFMDASLSVCAPMLFMMDKGR